MNIIKAMRSSYETVDSFISSVLDWLSLEMKGVQWKLKLNDQ